MRKFSVDSDDDTQYENYDMEPLDDDYLDNNLSDSPDDLAHAPEKRYTVLTEGDIQQRQEDDIGRISTLLSVSKVDACVLLCRYNWSVEKAQEMWFANEDGVRKTCGILEKDVVWVRKKGKIFCGICLENKPSKKICSAACGHSYCTTCWITYISISITDGPGCLMLGCPEPSCGAAVGRDMIDKMASDEDQAKYCRYLLKSYVESKRNTKWCPAPGCDYAIEYVIGSDNFDVSCLCSHSFCWNCGEEVHRPVDCDTVANWMLKNSVESENTNWILANSKPCPKCNRPIQKNQGCMRMTCTPPCTFQFCWVCLSPWFDHGGSFFSCNRYEAKNDADEKRKMYKHSLVRHTHYYERWTANQSSRRKALSNLQKIQTLQLKELEDKQGYICLRFIVDAWLQIVECRRLLKWTYAYGYYLPEHEHAKKEFFEYLQGLAEASLERLHQCAEKELQTFLEAEGPSQDYGNFRIKLIDLTKITQNQFENLGSALENGLSEIDSRGAELYKMQKL